MAAEQDLRKRNRQTRTNVSEEPRHRQTRTEVGEPRQGTKRYRETELDNQPPVSQSASADRPVSNQSCLQPSGKISVMSRRESPRKSSLAYVKDGQQSNFSNDETMAVEQDHRKRNRQTRSEVSEKPKHRRKTTRFRGTRKDKQPPVSQSASVDSPVADPRPIPPSGEFSGMSRRESHPRSSFANIKAGPYMARTPKSKTLLPNPQDEPEEVLATQLNESNIAATSWKTFRLSALYGFKYTTPNLLKFSRFIASYIEMEQRKDYAIDIEAPKKYNVVINTIASFTPNDSQTLKIVVTSNMDDDPDVYFTGFLTSFGRNTEYWEGLDQDGNLTILPLFLAKGKKAIVNSVILSIQEQFGCTVLPLTFSSTDLKWMLTMCTAFELGTKPLFIEYISPRKELQTILYYLDNDSAGKIWRRIHEVDSNEVTIEEVNKFFQAIEKHFFVMIGINLSHLHINAIGTSVATMNRSGSIKILNSDGIIFILRHLTTLAQEYWI